MDRSRKGGTKLIIASLMALDTSFNTFFLFFQFHMIFEKWDGGKISTLRNIFLRIPYINSFKANFPSPLIPSKLQQINGTSYTPRTLRACCSQSGLTILKIRKSSVRALFLYNCTTNTLRVR